MRTSTAVSITQLADIRTRSDGGWLRMYEGSRPSTVSGSTSEPVVGEVHLASPAFDMPTGNSMPFLTAASSQVLVGGTSPDWFRLYESDGTTIIADGTISPTGDLQISVAELVVGVSIDVTGASLSVPQT